MLLKLLLSRFQFGFLWEEQRRLDHKDHTNCHCQAQHYLERNKFRGGSTRCSKFFSCTYLEDGQLGLQPDPAENEWENGRCWCEHGDQRERDHGQGAIEDNPLDTSNDPVCHRKGDWSFTQRRCTCGPEDHSEGHHLDEAPDQIDVRRGQVKDLKRRHKYCISS